jgi:DUF2971 family protein
MRQSDWLGSVAMLEIEADKYFFHYTTRDRAFGGILQAGIRFSLYRNMRDPMETRLRFSEDEYDEATGETHVISPEFQSAVRSRRESSRLISLTEDAEPTDAEPDPFCRGWARARMWEQYAEDHQGVCLVLDREGFLTEVGTLGLAPLQHFPVDYGAPPQAEYGYPMRELVFPTDDMMRDYFEGNWSPLFFSKTPDWSSQHEYRIVTSDRLDDPTDIYVNLGSSLRYVIAGERFPHWENPTLVSACKKAGAQPVELSWTTATPRLQAIDS